MKKTIMILIIMAAALMALPTMAQKNWGTQRPVYGSQYRPQQATMPTATYHPGTYNSGTYRAGTFHSTGSTMMRTGSSYSSSPLLNKNGSAAYNGPSYAPSRRYSNGPLRSLIDHGGGGGGGEGGGGDSGEPDPGSGSGGGGIGTPPDDDGTPPNGFPLGDAMLPLTLLACAYMCLRAFLKRKRATEN